MSRRAVLTAAWLSMAAMDGCSAVVRELELGCGDDCAALNRAENLETACVRYQCRADNKGCTKRPLDRDEDGFADVNVCADAGLRTRLDCDDSSDATAPGAPELCDGADNDCNGQIDEGALRADSLQKRAQFEVSGISGLTYGPGPMGQLLLAVTAAATGQARTTLQLWPQQRALPLQSERLDERTCVDRLRHCVLSEVAVAATSETLVALAIEGAGPDRGRVRFAPLHDWSAAADPVLLWDGAEANKSASNLKAGVDSAPLCDDSQRAQGANNPSFVLGSGPRPTGLALWRSRQAPAPLVGLSVGVTSGSAGVQVDALDGPCARALDDQESDRVGFDPVSLQAFRGAGKSGYFAAFDSARGVELMWIEQLEQGAARAFATARAHRLLVPELGARHVVVSEGPGEEDPILGLAWRAGDQIRFLRVAFNASEGSFRPLTEPQTLAQTAALADGPALTYAAQGFETASDEGAGGGWLAVWSDGSAQVGRLMAARISERSGELVGESFALFEGDAVSHVLAYPNEGQLGYGFVSGGDQLNIGSLACGP